MTGTPNTAEVKALGALADYIYARNPLDQAVTIADINAVSGTQLSTTLQGTTSGLDPASIAAGLHRADHGFFYSDRGFVGAIVDGCSFPPRATFREASFKGADLASTLTGAKYSCATKLPKDLDPMAAGMINLDGTCPAP